MVLNVYLIPLVLSTPAVTITKIVANPKLTKMQVTIVYSTTIVVRESG
jgi:hypothetical protein